MIAAEQKARSTYDNILRLCKDYPDVYEPIKFLRAREVVHFQRLVKHSVWCRINWMRKISMHSIRRLTARLHAWIRRNVIVRNKDFLGLNPI